MKIDIFLICTLLLTSQFVLKGQPIQLDTVYNCPSEQSEDADFYVLDFWATWCRPCIQTIPHVNEVYQNNIFKNIRFIAVTDQNPTIINKFTTYNTDIKTCIGINKDFTILQQYGFRPAIPKVLIIDKEGNLLWDGEPLELDTSLLRSLVNGKATSRKDFSIQYSIKGPIHLDSGSVWIGRRGEFRKIEMYNRPIVNLYSQVIQLRERSPIKIEANLEDINDPQFKYNFSCDFSMDSSVQDIQFYNKCLDVLNGTFNTSLKERIDTLDYYNFYISDSIKLHKYKSVSDSVISNFTNEYFIYKNYALRWLILDLITLYNLESEYIFKEFPEKHNIRLDLNFKNVTLENLKTELNKIGISYSIEPKAVKVYTLEFEKTVNESSP